MFDLIFLYYDNPAMLAAQIECWNTYVGLDDCLCITVIDDGSPRVPAHEIICKNRCIVPLKLFRIDVDIPWNFSGARNLGVMHATDWVYVSDIDTLLLRDDAEKMLRGIALDRNSFYMFNRVWLPDLVAGSAGLVNLLFHRQKYEEIGGYDEDYAGNYGKEESDFKLRMQNAATLVYCDDIMLRVVPPKLIADARTRGLLRDKTQNISIFEEKRAAGFLRPRHCLRFPWRRLL